MALHLAELAGVRAEVEAALDTPHDGQVLFVEAGPGAPRLPRINIARALDAAGVFSWRSDSGYTATDALRGAVSQIQKVAPDALLRAGAYELCEVADVSNVGGLRYWDLLRALTIRLLERDLGPVAQALWDAAQPHVARTHSTVAKPGCVDDATWHLHQRVVQPAMARLAEEYADEILRDLVRFNTLRENEDYAAICAALYAEGYVEVQVPVRAPASAKVS